ncbi:recQ-mediated genome instability protein 2-like [Lingula anatina]|uniref:RecQ-mediated genome instability protein 2-like n=1 Tax=Lingula anatina TaxID=7574 RepID=A0A2R2MI66_LINAN|nr:recQ-mediated genome instability protein 2-like [Lingula anatina]XP_023929906.1 recQ-mediated genome instability protein 2-like [Lingula anatina]XP_023929907.1 recQ-mediated genome instability protein 2-like [Lingula anatina]XP_023929908.1 recQ-mediated genome instability protein 2-like [Lingula anatina]|eukprot:XP_023929905.1 recQ-mediated genome instability protein 2-like [Lingula anatina]
MSTSKLSLPARKLLVQDLQYCKQVSPATKDSEPASCVTYWTMSTNGKDVSFGMVWVQGVVKQVSEEGFCMLDDGTGVVMIILHKLIPKGCSKVETGKYMMVVGSLLSAGDTPRVRAVKVQDLSPSQAIQQASWPLEVVDLQLHGDS